MAAAKKYSYAAKLHFLCPILFFSLNAHFGQRGHSDLCHQWSEVQTTKAITHVGEKMSLWKVKGSDKCIEMKKALRDSKEFHTQMKIQGI